MVMIQKATTKSFPIYYKYPGDGFNNWKVIVETEENVFYGTSKVYPGGRLLDPVRAYGFYMATDLTPITLAEAAQLSK